MVQHTLAIRHKHNFHPKEFQSRLQVETNRETQFRGHFALCWSNDWHRDGTSQLLNETLSARRHIGTGGSNAVQWVTLFMNVHFITFGILNQGLCSSTDCVTELNTGKKNLWNWIGCDIQLAGLDNPVVLPCCKLYEVMKGATFKTPLSLSL